MRWIFQCGLVILLVSVGQFVAARAPAQSDQELVGLNRQVVQLLVAGKFGEAIPIAQQAVALAERLHGSKHMKVAGPLGNLAQLYVYQGRYAEAEPLYKRSLAIKERALGPEHPDVGITVNNLALLYRIQGRYAEAEPLYKRDLKILEKSKGSNDPEVGTSLMNLGVLYYTQARYTEAEPIYKRAIAIKEAAFGRDHPDVAAVLVNLGVLFQHQGRYAEAESLYKRSLSILEKALGPEHPKIGSMLNRFASLYSLQGRYEEAEPIYKRAIAIHERTLGPNHPDTAESLNSLAGLYQAQGRYAEAEPLYRRALSIRERVLGPNNSLVATSSHDLAVLLRLQRRDLEAEQLYKRALTVWEKELGPDNDDVAEVLSGLAVLYRWQGRYAEAEPLYKRALAIFERRQGRDHPYVGRVLDGLATLHFAQGQWAKAADNWRQSTDVVIQRVRRGNTIGAALTGRGKSEAEQESHRFRGLVRAVYRLADAAPAQKQKLTAEMFETAQWAQASEAAASLAQMAARQAMGGGALATLVRERQDLVGEWQLKDKILIRARSEMSDRRNPESEALLSARLAAIDARIVEIDKVLAKDFPDYAALASPEPLGVTDVQSLLNDGEALLLFLDTRQLNEWKAIPEETFYWLVTKKEAQWIRIDHGTKALADRVAALRCGLDATLWDDAGSARSCKDALGAAPRIESVAIGGKDERVQILPFDLARGNELYKALFGPVEDMVKGKRLLIVPSGPLMNLPFSVLVAAPPTRAIPETLAQYRDAAWLGTRTAIAILPSVASLKALRKFAKTSHASKPYLGIGNPLLDGAQDDPVWGAEEKKRAELARTRRCSQTSSPQQIASARGPRSVRSFASMFHGSQVDIEQIRDQAPLPETADELCEVARRLGVPDSEILLGADATEARLKDLSEQGRLADYAILHFATHGALSGQVEGSGEPGLILTPPPKDTSDPRALERDDGFLTASEIAALKLDADWVILSACNTAGAQGVRSEALSGMARAFFYAGARALLVSHWAVGSDAAVKLTTRTFAELKAHPEIGRAEAFRISMKELIEKGDLSEAHPSQWAPFVIVGEGAASK